MSALPALVGLASIGSLSVNWGLLGTVLSASLLGSVHCLGMCGPFVAVYSAAEAGDPKGLSLGERALPHLAYHGGRALTYISLGALGGAAGAAVNWAGEAAGLVHVAALVSGAMVILWGLALLFPRLRVKSPIGAMLGRHLAQLGRKPRVFRASMLGVFTPILPCGWLYAFVITAAGTGTWLSGALVMTAFWMGTVPALLGMGAIVSRLSAGLRARLPVITGVSLIVIGSLVVVNRWSRPLPALSHGGDAASLPADTIPRDGPACH